MNYPLPLFFCWPSRYFSLCSSGYLLFLCVASCSRLVVHKWTNFLDIENTAIKERGSAQSGQMEGANHCYEIEMTSNYLLAALRASVPPLCHISSFLSSVFVCLLSWWWWNSSGRSKKENSSVFFFNVETGKIGVVKQSLVPHRERQLPAVGNQWSFLQINSIQLWSTVHCRF